MSFTTTSGTFDFSLDVDQLIHRAASRAGGEPTSGEEANSFINELNLLLIDLQSRGCPLAKRNEHDFTFDEIEQEYITLPSYVYDVTSVQLFESTTFKGKLKRLPLDRYRNLQPKTGGQPSLFAVDRNTSSCLLYVNPLNDSVGYTLRAVTLDKFEDITGMAQAIDISSRFYPALLAGLAHRIADVRWQSVPIDRRSELKMEYESLLSTAMKEDRERTPLRIRRKGYFGKQGYR